MHESLIHGVTAHNWFVHYLWDIYGGFGHNGKIIQCTLPSHTHPYSAIMLKIDCLGPLFETSCTLEEKHVRESLRRGVTTPITGLHITFGTYMEALGTMGR